MIGIYKITNKINNKIYIGKSVNIQERWNEHKRESLLPEEKWLANKRGERTYFHSAIRKYGIDSFTWEIIEECDEKQLNEKEQYWIKFYDSNNKEKGYNMTLGGDGFYFGKGEDSFCAKITQTECDIIKQKLKERWTAKQIQELVPNASNSTISNINYGINWFDPNETYPISINNGHRIWSNEEAMKIKEEYANGETIQKLAEKYEVNPHTISRLVKGQTYTDLPILERKVEWFRINKKRPFSNEEVKYLRDLSKTNSIMSLFKQYENRCSYSAFYNMIKGKTYKDVI